MKLIVSDYFCEVCNYTCLELAGQGYLNWVYQFALYQGFDDETIQNEVESHIKERILLHAKRHHNISPADIPATKSDSMVTVRADAEQPPIWELKGRA